MYNVIVGFLYEAEQGMSIYWQQNTCIRHTILLNAQEVVKPPIVVHQLCRWLKEEPELDNSYHFEVHIRISSVCLSTNVCLSSTMYMYPTEF